MIIFKDFTKIFDAYYEIEDVRETELFHNWIKERDRSWLFCEVRMNFNDLQESLNNYIKLTYKLQNSNQSSINRHQRNLIRKISSFLFSATRFYELFSSKDYNSDIHCFFFEFRNYITHKNIFPLISVNTIIPYDDRFESFSKNEFLEYLDFVINKDKKERRIGTRKAKLYLDKLADKPNIEILFQKYFNSIEADFSEIYLSFFYNNRIRLKELIQKIEKINIKKESLIAIGLVPPLRSSEIRLIKYLIEKSNPV